MDGRTRWTDDRLDDLASTVKANDHRLDVTQDKTQDNEKSIRSLLEEQSGHKHALINRWLIAAALASPVASLIIAYTHK